MAMSRQEEASIFSYWAHQRPYHTFQGMFRDAKNIVMTEEQRVVVQELEETLQALEQNIRDKQKQTAEMLGLWDAAAFAKLHMESVKMAIFLLQQRNKNNTLMPEAVEEIGLLTRSIRQTQAIIDNPLAPETKEAGDALEKEIKKHVSDFEKNNPLVKNYLRKQRWMKWLIFALLAIVIAGLIAIIAACCIACPPVAVAVLVGGFVAVSGGGLGAITTNVVYDRFERSKNSGEARRLIAPKRAIGSLFGQNKALLGRQRELTQPQQAVELRVQGNC